jgi:hypothetical protein
MHCVAVHQISAADASRLVSRAGAYASAPTTLILSLLARIGAHRHSSANFAGDTEAQQLRSPLPDGTKQNQEAEHQAARPEQTTVSGRARTCSHDSSHRRRGKSSRHLQCPGVILETRLCLSRLLARWASFRLHPARAVVGDVHDKVLTLRAGRSALRCWRMACPKAVGDLGCTSGGFLQIGPDYISVECLPPRTQCRESKVQGIVDSPIPESKVWRVS